MHRDLLMSQWVQGPESSGPTSLSRVTVPAELTILIRSKKVGAAPAPAIVGVVARGGIIPYNVFYGI